MLRINRISRKTITSIIWGVFLLLCVGVLFMPSQVGAVELTNEYGSNMGLSDAPLDDTIVNILNWLLGFLALVAVIFIIYGGFVWMTAAGNDERITKAKKIIIGALIGLVIVMLSWAIVQFVITGVEEGGGGPGGIPGDDPVGPGPGASTFKVDWASPTDMGASLCTLVQIEFNDKVNFDTVTPDGNITIEQASDSTDVIGVWDISDDEEIISFRPSELLLPSDTYTVDLTDAVMSQTGVELTPFMWSFTTGMEEDDDPPFVDQSAIWPSDGATDVCLTTPVTVWFNEPMDVLRFKKDNISIFPDDPAGIEATNVDVLDEYRMTFYFDEPLNPDTAYTITIKSTDLNDGDEIIDVCENPLDGNEDGVEGDSFPSDPITWTFTTGTDEACPPTIVSMDSNGYYDGGGMMTITGFNFTGAQQHVYFFDDADAGNDSCLTAGNFFPEAACIESWTNTEILLRPPAKGGVTTNGADDGDVRVEIGEGASAVPSNTKDFNLKSPYITGMDPNDGQVGRTVTVYGKDFGNSAGTVWFRTPPGEPKFEGVPPQCANYWWDDHILITIPEGLDPGTAWVQVERGDGKHSNIHWTFTINNETGPLLCEIEPECGDAGESVILGGQGFGNVADTVVFDATSADINNWTANTIDAVVPGGLLGELFVAVVVGGNASNSLPFESPCGSGGPSGDEHAACAGGECITVSGEGPDECSGPGDCTGSGDTHSECDGDECTVVEGAGVNECSEPDDCIGGGETHAACAGDECITVSGEGPDECSGPGDCTGSDTHSECDGDDCIIAEGGGVNECTEPDECTEDPGTGDDCDGIPDTDVCDPNSALCLEPGEYCRESDCTCRTGDPCDDTPETPECDPDITMCDADEYCADDCICHEGAPCDGNLETLDCEPEPAMCILPDQLCNPDNCTCLPPPEYDCSSEIWTCSVDQTACEVGFGCDEECQCVARPTITSRFPEDGQVDVCRNTVIEVEFDQAMESGSINYDTFQLYLGNSNDGDPCIDDTECRSSVCSPDTLTCVGDYVSGSFDHNNSYTFQYRPGLLIRNAIYHIQVVGDDELGVLSENGFSLVANADWSFTVIDTEDVCQLTSVEIDPGYRLYTFEGETQDYTVNTYYYTQPIDLIPGIYEWTYDWSSDNDTIVTIPPASVLRDVVGTAQNRSDETFINVDVEVISVGYEKTLSDDSKAVVELCENPWPVEDWPYNDDPTNFSVWYCRDEGLPAFTEVVAVDGPDLEPEILREVFFTGLQLCEGTRVDCSAVEFGGPGPEICEEYTSTCVTSEDAIGIRVMKNTEKYTPKLWFTKGLPDEIIGSAKNEEDIDGYLYMTVGRTKYVGATNLVAPSLYANMYLISYNQEASDITKDIYKEMVRNWKFNTNVVDYSDKEKLENDMKRMGWLHDVRDAAQNLYANEGYFPDLATGSYIPNRSTSAWDQSWGTTLGNQFGKRLPVDPRNVFNTESCPASEGYNPATCWDPEESVEQFGEEGGRFTCVLPGSNVLMYKNKPQDSSHVACDSDGDTPECDPNSAMCPGDEYCDASDCTCRQKVELYANLEYASDWVTGLVNPCSDQTFSTCACFNYSELVSPE